MRYTHFLFSILILILVSGFTFSEVYSQKSLGMAITASAEKGSDTITLMGKTMSTLTDVTFTVTSPSGDNVVAVGQITPDENGDFATIIEIKPIWTENGFYEITAMNSVVRNSLYTLSVLVEVNNGLAERTFVTDSNLEPGIFELYKGNTAAQGAGLVLDEIDYVWGSTMFEVSGITDRVSEAITLTITAPNGNVVLLDKVVATLDGEFTFVIPIGGSLWKQNGDYTITAYQNENPKYSDSIAVDIEEGVIVGSQPSSKPEPKEEEILDEIEKVDENYYEPAPRDWQTSGPFQIDRSEYVLGEKIFIRIEGLEHNEKGEIVVMRQLNSNQYSEYQTIPFDGAQKSAFNYYIQPQLSKIKGICSIDDIAGNWTIVFSGTDYADLKFKITNEIIPGEEDIYEPIYGKCPDKSIAESTTKSKELVASFVDKSKDPQSYIDRYNNEPSYKKWFHDNYPEYDSIEQAVGLELTEKIPDWVKNIFGWYSQDQVSEDELLNAIKYLINEEILIVN